MNRYSKIAERLVTSVSGVKIQYAPEELLDALRKEFGRKNVRARPESAGRGARYTNLFSVVVDLGAQAGEAMERLMAQKKIKDLIRRYGSPITRQASRIASLQRYCFIYKAKDGNWYMDLADQEHGTERDAYSYGPFPSEDAVHEYLHRNHSNPGGAQIDDSGRQPVPRRSPNGAPVEKPKKRRWSSGRVAAKGEREAQWLVNETGGFRGALVALAQVATKEWRDTLFGKRISKVLMGVANTIGRLEQAERALAASDERGEI